MNKVICLSGNDWDVVIIHQHILALSLPEVTEVRHNEDGTIVLTIHAVCDSVVCNDAVITHELTMKIQDDGTIQYVGNRILDNGIDNIPRYQYRLGNLQN